MKNTMKAGALVVAGIFALSGCSSSGENADTASESSPSATPTPTPTPTLAVGQEQYTADELEAALTAVQEKEGLTGQVVNDATLRPDLAKVDQAIESITITPVECSALATANLGEKIGRANVAVMQLSTTDALTVISYEDASFIDEQVRNNDQQMSDCAEFQMEAQGQVFIAGAEEMDASTEAVTTQAYRVGISSAGRETVSYQIGAFSGTTNISIAIGNPADAEEAVTKAEEVINAVLAELENQA